MGALVLRSDTFQVRIHASIAAITCWRVSVSAGGSDTALPERSRQCEQSWQYAVLSKYVPDRFFITPAPCHGSSLPCVAKTRCVPTKGRLPPNRASNAAVSGNTDALYASNVV